MKELGRPLHFTVTATTRPKRPGEVNGQDYHFLSPEAFQDMLKRGELLEWAEVYGHLYGVPKAQVRQALARGQDVMVKIDVQGAEHIRQVAPQSVLIFLAPPSTEELARRLRERKTESAAQLELRLKTAREEMERLPLFDYVVVNEQGRLDEAVAQIEAIITAEKCRVNPRQVEI